MKFTSIAIISAIAFTQTSFAQTGCAAQDVLTRCLDMEDNYLKTCNQQDYPCLCKWHQAKLSCYDNCPNDLGSATQKGLKDTYCSIVEAQNKTANALSAVGSAVASATSLPNASATTALPSTVPNKSTNNTTATSASSPNTYNNNFYGIFMCLAGVTTYFLI